MRARFSRSGKNYGGGFGCAGGGSPCPGLRKNLVIPSSCNLVRDWRPWPPPAGKRARDSRRGGKTKKPAASSGKAPVFDKWVCVALTQERNTPLRDRPAKRPHPKTAREALQTCHRCTTYTGRSSIVPFRAKTFFLQTRNFSFRCRDVSFPNLSCFSPPSEEE